MKTVGELRDVFFRNFAASDQYGMIFTVMIAFDMKEDWDYLEHVRQIFEPCGTEFYYVELIAPQDVRLGRNVTENRLKNKASKNDLEISNLRLVEADEHHRCVSNEGEFPYENYLRIDNSEMPPAEAARLIKETFDL